MTNGRDIKCKLRINIRVAWEKCHAWSTGNKIKGSLMFYPGGEDPQIFTPDLDHMKKKHSFGSRSDSNSK